MSLDVGLLFEQHRRPLAAFIRARVDPDEVDDVIQETFARAWKSRDQYHDLGYAPTSWLYVIARNLISDRRAARQAKRRGQEVSLSPEYIERRATADAGSSRHVEAIHVRAVLDAMPSDGQRRVLTMNYLEGQTSAQTAAELGITEEAVKKLAQRGRYQFSRAYGPRGGDAA